MRAQRILVVIPARDEAPTIAKVVQEIRAAGLFDVLVINDSSRDATAALAVTAGARVLSPVLPLGAWCAMQTGIRYAVRHGYTVVVTMDADGQHQSHELPQLLTPLRGGANAVIGACPARGSAARKIAWAFFRRITGLNYADLTSGFRAYDARAITVLAGEQATLLDYQDIGVLLMLRRAGLHIAEVPVAMQARRNGKSKIFHSWLSVFGYLLKTGLLCLAYWRNSPQKA